MKTIIHSIECALDYVINLTLQIQIVNMFWAFHGIFHIYTNTVPLTITVNPLINITD